MKLTAKWCQNLQFQKQLWKVLADWHVSRLSFFLLAWIKLSLIIYFRAFKSRIMTVSSPFMSNLPLTEAPDQPSNLPKLAPGTTFFVQDDGSTGVV